MLRILGKQSFTVYDVIIVGGWGLLGYEGMIFNHLEGQLDTGMMMKSLLGYCHERQVNVMTGRRSLASGKRLKILKLTFFLCSKYPVKYWDCALMHLPLRLYLLI